MNDVSDTLQQRHETYGEYATQARIAQQLKDVMHDTPNWHTMTYAQRESLDMIAAKISRILNGDPDHIDSWHDIGGYARLVEDRIHEVLDRPVPPVL
jgi:hypothetical protein